ncbi:hypothetical protein HMPREF1624_06164 [Sporothrix schenckii ATCC 58251]|uniref:Nucleoporin Nup159/Nup146 N-terminal domain-containing protein n=1 Tax=Sporothrix schenckii (strain ATCC 58251 / de Perez 2211183) TaxID=1391915 RepID=U7PSU0_SPOS1|nr:hypothetical protein HMPREF1624_06164 [Sporothrix schenckii ATCC 58251]
MAFNSFGRLGGGDGAGAGASGGQATQGQDLELIQTEGLGFLNLAGETKLQFVTKWAEPPLPTASLISVASRKGLVAAAGPDAVHVATTDSVRKAITAEGSGGDDSDIRPFTPQFKIPMPMRISQLAFTADEAYLILSAETGGGLAVYDVQATAQSGSTQSAFELSTNGETLRSLVVNPMADKAELCALVTANGSLLMADLKQRSLRNGPSGQPVLRSQVSCAAWSSKGKQLVAGCADGSFYQMTPDGQEKAHIPKPPQLGDYYVASISWLENDVFLVVHNPTTPGDPSAYHLVTRSKNGTSSDFVYQKLNDPVEPFGDKTPHHTVLRLRDFPPNLQDLLLVSSTAVENIGLITRSKSPLASNAAAEKITNVFTTTELADDSRRAQLPMSADYNDTYPIGVALDLSSTDKVHKPIPTDEMDESPGPLPGLWVLNNEGVLVAWWIVYNESIRQGTTYPGLIAAGGAASAQPIAASTTPTASAFSSPKPSAPAFATSATPASPAPAFGGAAALGSSASPWGRTSGGTSAASPARAPAFGAPSALGGSAIGAPSGLGAKSSPWGSSAAAPAFGQSSFGSASAAAAAPSSGGFSAFASKSNASPFGSAVTSSEKTSSASPFGAFVATSQTGFASLGAGTSSDGSIFASSSGNKSSPFASTNATSAFGAPSTDTKNTLFAAPADKLSSGTGTSAFGSTPFVLGTTFKADPATANDNEKTPQKSGGLFGSGFGLSLTDSAKETSVDQKDEAMDVPTPSAPTPAATEAKPTAGLFESTTPTTTPAPAGRFFDPVTSNDSPAPTSLFGKPSTGATTGTTSLFGMPSGTTAGTTTSTSSMFGKPSGETSTAPSPFSKPAEGSATLASSIFSKPSGATPAPSLFGKPSGSTAPTTTGLFAQPAGAGTGLFGGFTKPAQQTKKEDDHKASAPEDSAAAKAAESKPLPEQNAPLPPDTISKDPYPLGESSSSSGASSIQSTQPAQSPPAQVTQLSSNKVAAEEDAPLPPLPPNPFSSKAKKSSSLAEPPLPPLPPNPFSTKPKAKEPAEPPLPPDPFTKPQAKTETGKPVPTAGIPEDAPLPPDPFTSKAKVTAKADKPPAGTSSLFSDSLNKAKDAPKADKTSAGTSSLFSNLKPSAFDSSKSIFSSVSTMKNEPGLNNPFANLKPPPSPTTDGSEEDDEEEDESEEDVEEGDKDEEEDEEDAPEEEDNEDEEGSGTDVGKDLSRSTTGFVQTPSFTTHGSFTTVGANDAGGSSVFSQVEAPRSQPFGQQPALRPRHQQDTSPRSPSPQRPPAKPQAAGVSGRLFREDSQRSFSAPGMASQLLRDSSRQGRLPAAGPSAAQGFGGGGNHFANRRVPRDSNLEEQRKVNEARAAAEAKELAQEDSYDVMDRELDQPLAPTRQLAECLYILDSDISGGDTVASQVEAVYRDINRMILVLKLNGRNIDAFLRGHSQVDRKTEEDLDDADGWVLCDVDALGAIVSRDLPSKLRQSRVKGESEILADSEALLKDASRLQVMHDDMVRIIQSQASPDQVTAARSLPLSAEQATQQNDLRRTFTKFMERLVEAEQQLVLLRTKISALTAAIGGSNGANGRGSPVPTVDAVMRTIARMTAMAEKRSGDIDVLEAQIRKLNLNPRSREGSPFSTPQKQKQKRSSLIFAPGSAQRSTHRSSAIFSSPGLSAQGTPTRKKLTGYTDTEKDQLRQKRASRQRTLDRLQKIQQAEGPRYMPIDE